MLPVLVFQTDGKAVQDRTRTPTTLTMLVPGTGGDGAFSVSDHNGGAELSARGNSSFYYEKKSYRLELQDEKGKDRKAPLLGMPADSDWVLYASVTDKTFTRNVLGHELWRSTGRYAVRWRFAEVFVITNAFPGTAFKPERLAADLPKVLQSLTVTNRAAAIESFSNSNNPVAAQLAESYMGVYVLLEKIKRGKERVNIQRLRPGDTNEPAVSGGYIIKKDDEEPGERGLTTGQEFKLRFEEPKERETDAGQRQWLAKYLGSFEKILFGLDFRNSSQGYQQFVDVDSFIDFHWLVEAAQNAFTIRLRESKYTGS